MTTYYAPPTVPPGSGRVADHRGAVVVESLAVAMQLAAPGDIVIAGFGEHRDSSPQEDDD